MVGIVSISKIYLKEDSLRKIVQKNEGTDAYGNKLARTRQRNKSIIIWLQSNNI